MATTITSSAITAQGYTLKSYLTYEVTTNNDTTYAIKVSEAGIWIQNPRLHMSGSKAYSTLSATGYTESKVEASVYNPTSSSYYQPYITDKTFSWTKGTSTASKTIQNVISFNSASYFYGQTATASLAVTVPTKTKYTVSYNANGGSGAPSAQTKWYGTTLTLSATKPTRTGYTFKGWATSSSGSVAYAAGASYTANAAVTLYAVWQINSWTVSYNANGGSGSIANQTKTYGVNLTLSNGAGFTRSLYNLDHWNTKADNSGTTYAKSATYSSNAALSLYAIWKLDYIKPTFSNFTCYRVASNGSTTETDDGEYIYISFDYVGGSIDGGVTPIAPTCVITIGGTTVYNTTESSGTGTVTQWFGTYSKDNSYAVSVKLYDSNYATGVTKTATISTAIYLIDAIGSGADVYAGVMHAAVNGQKLTLPQTNVDGALTINNSVTIGGTLTIANHSSTVGTVQIASGSGISLASGTTFVSLDTDAKLTLSMGSWVVSGTVSYASNGTGYRSIRFYAGSTAYTAGTARTTAVSGAVTYLTTVLLITITSSSADVYLQGQQNSGSALTATSYLRAMRIA